MEGGRTVCIDGYTNSLLLILRRPLHILPAVITARSLSFSHIPYSKPSTSYLMDINSPQSACDFWNSLSVIYWIISNKLYRILYFTSTTSCQNLETMTFVKLPLPWAKLFLQWKPLIITLHLWRWREFIMPTGFPDLCLILELQKSTLYWM